MEAAIGLVGVVIGGLLTWLTTQASLERDRRHALYTALRLVHIELFVAREQLRYTVETRKWWIGGESATATWQEQKAVIAADRDFAGFGKVVKAYANLGPLDHWRQVSADRENLPTNFDEAQAVCLQAITDAMEVVAARFMELAPPPPSNVIGYVQRAGRITPRAPAAARPAPPAKPPTPPA